MANILLINEKRSKMDLSAVKDTEGKMVILQPKGSAGSTRECHEDVLEHPHVVSMVNAKWLSHRPVSLKPALPETVTPAKTETVTPPSPPPATQATTAPVTVPSEENQVAEEETVLPTETVETSDATTTMTSSKKERRNRRDD